jgi:signal transduction histidine kinase
MDGPCILIVEDHESIRMAIQDVLEAEGYSVLTAGNGVQALRVMEETSPDLIIADITMPEMDGYAFYEAMRSRPEWVPIPFVFLSARTERRDVLKGKALGVEDYLTKPIDPEEMLMVIRARLGRARAVRRSAEEKAQAEVALLKQQIITFLGHELRTPLTYIVGYTELALDDIPGLSPGRFKESLEAIGQGADRLTHLFNDFLLLLHVDTGRAAEVFQEMSRLHTDLGEIVERTVTQYTSQAVAKNVTLRMNVASHLPPVWACEPFLVDALGRLVDNAIKFSGNEGKQVLVSTCIVEGWIEIAVTDEGVGISPDDMPHLFERFRQIGRERMEQRGVGLGLAIARELIRLHGGEIGAESVPGKGSVFTVRLPVTEEGA